MKYITCYINKENVNNDKKLLLLLLLITYY